MTTKLSNIVKSEIFNTFDYLDQEHDTVGLTFEIPALTECWTLQVTLTQTQQQLLKAALSLKATYQLSNVDTEDAGLYITPRKLIDNNAVPNVTTQGYGSLRFPNKSSDVNFIAGKWQVVLGTTDGRIFPFQDFKNITATLVYSQLPVVNKPVSNVYRLSLKFILVATRDQLNDAGLDLVNKVKYAITHVQSDIYNDPRIFNIRIVQATSPQSGLVETYTSDKTYTYDVTDPDTLALVKRYASPEYITVFAMTNLTLPNVSTTAKAVGISMISGPQGTVTGSTAPWSKVLIKVLPCTMKALALRFAHEIGHYLGLNHVNACLGSSKTNNPYNDDVCQATLKSTSGSPVDAINGSLMFSQQDDTLAKGGALGAAERFILPLNPIVIHTQTMSNSPATPLNTIDITIKTGTGFRHGLFVGAGTDNIVSFQLNFSNVNRSYTYPATGREKIGSSDGYDDFESGDIKTYSFIVPSNADAVLEELVGFTIFKSSGISYSYSDETGSVPAYDDDQWLLQGLIIKVNSILKYNHINDINTWLSDDAGKGISYISRPFDSSASVSTLHTQGVAVQILQTTPSYVTPPFIAFPVHMIFSPNLSAVTTPNWSTFGLTGPKITIEAWVLCQVSSIGNVQVLAMGGDLNNGIFLRLNNGNYEIGTATSGVMQVLKASIPQTDLNHWVHISGCYDGTTMSLYRNSIIMNQLSAPGIYPTSITGDLNIGWFANNGSPSWYFNGYIRNVCLWQNSRSASQIQADMSVPDPLDPDIIGIWLLNENEGSTAYDSSFSTQGAKPGTISNPVWYAPSNSGTAAAVAILGNNLSSPVYLSLPATSKIQSGLSGGSVTVMGWVRISNNGWNPQSGLIFFGTDTFSLGISKGSYYFGYNDQSLAARVLVPDGDPGQWVHLAGQYDASTFTWTIWRNGFPLGTAKSGKGIVNTDPTWYIGGRPQIPNSPYTVEYQRVWLFGKAISQINLRTQYLPYIYNQTLPSTVSSDNLLAFWALDEGAGSNIYDLSGITPLSETTFTDSNILRGTVRSTPNYRFVDTGTTISSVLSSITDASKTNIYTVFIGAGNFTEQVSVPSWIILTGSGEGITNITINAQTAFPYGAVIPSSNTMIRQIQIIVNLLSNQVDPIALPIEVTGATNVALDSVTTQVNVTGTATNSTICALGLDLTQSGLPASVAAVNCTFAAQTAPSGMTVYLIGVNNSSSLIMIGSSVVYSSTIPEQYVVYASNSSTATFQQCALTANPNNICLITDSNSTMTVQGCKITGSTQGNITTLPPNPPSPNRR